MQYPFGGVRNQEPYAEKFKRDSAFQIRSSWAQFLSIWIFVLFVFSITYVFSIHLNFPIPPAGTILNNTRRKLGKWPAKYILSAFGTPQRNSAR